MIQPERGLWLSTVTNPGDVETFAARAVRLDDAAVVRLRQRADGLVGMWVATGFDVLATRAVGGRVNPRDLTVGADALAAGVRAIDGDGYVDPGFAMDSAWRGALPPETGFVHLDDLPARVVLDLAERGGELVKEHSSAHGPPVSLLDQKVVEVSSGDQSVGIPMRSVFTLTAMGFLPQNSDAVPDGEIVRVRVSPAWLRIDARYGSVYRRRSGPLPVLT